MKPLLSIASAFSAALLSFLQPAFAITPLDNLPNEYKPLFSAIDKAGVKVLFSDTDQICRGSQGLYLRDRGVITVCSPTFPNWTLESLDTLRHEAHHVLQDCRAGDGIGGDIGLFFNSPSDLQKFISSSLSMFEIHQIISAYSSMDTPAGIILLELEAFAAAESITPSAIAKAISTTCSIE